MSNHHNSSDKGTVAAPLRSLGLSGPTRQFDNVKSDKLHGANSLHMTICLSCIAIKTVHVSR